MKIIFALILLVSCTSTSTTTSNLDSQKAVTETTKTANLDVPEYEVKEASLTFKPVWLKDGPKAFQAKEDKLYTYLTYESEPKATRAQACEVAKTSLRINIASRVINFIGEELNLPVTPPQVEVLKESVVGASIIKTYWELREYRLSARAKSEYQSYTCAILIKYENERLKNIFNQAAHIIFEKVGPDQINKMREKFISSLP